MEETAGIIQHVFLPIELPKGLTAKEIAYEERCILRVFCRALPGMQSQGNHFPNTLQAFHVWDQVQDLIDDVLLAQHLAGLKAGQSLPIYVRAQNAGLLVTLTDAGCDGYPVESVIVSTFATSQDSANVTSTAGSLIGTYPTMSVHVPRSQLLSSKALARQIISLNENMLSEAMPKRPKSNNFYDDMGDVPDPRFVTKWLCGLLCDGDSRSCTRIPKIVKKSRDEVLFGSPSSLPFRRLGIWMAIKVVLQILLVQELGPAVGWRTYKMILLKFMCLLSRKYEAITADVGVQVMAKIGRRWYKLSTYKDDEDPVVRAQLQEVQLIVEKAVEDLRGQLDKGWKAQVQKDSEEAKFVLSANFNFVKDSKHGLAPLKAYLKSRMDAKANDGQQTAASSIRVKTPVAELNLAKLSAVPFAETITFSSDCLEKLFCFEFTVLKNLPTEPPSDFEVVGKTFVSYLNAAEAAYAGDQVGISRAVLVALKILRWVDMAVCKSYPLMCQHVTGVPIEIIEHLMLPFGLDLRLAHELETYFRRRNREGTYPSLLSPYEALQLNSQYSVRHAAVCPEMQRKRLEILDEGEKKAAEKMDEARLRKRDWEHLQLQIQSLSCKCAYVYTRYNRSWQTCHKCNLIALASNMRVDIYEKPLPQEIELQNAIIFELLIPQAICYFREMLRGFLIHLGVLTTGEDCKSIWSDELNVHASTACTSLPVKLCSTHGPQVRYNPRYLHPSKDPTQFVIENSGDVKLCVGKQIIKPRINIPAKILERFVFRVECGSPYASLQWTLEDHDYKHSDNRILAKQHECPSSLTLNEFKEFGSIRAGQRIQLRNLYRALKQGTLSLRTESVLNLVYEVLWRAGPPSDDTTSPAHIRQAHVDLLNTGFVEEFLSVLGNLISSFEKNWDDHHTYATIIAILLRIYSISEDDAILEQCLAHLRECRRILRNWSKTIEMEMDTMENKPISYQSATRKKLLAVAVLCSMTFWIDFQHDTRHCLVEDVQQWLLAAKTTQEYLGKEFLSSCSKTFQNQLRRVRECGFANLDLFIGFLDADEEILQTFTKEVWSGFLRCDSERMHWRCYDGSTQWFDTEVSVGGCRTELQLDILEGHFWVNGRPEDYLPSELKNHADYWRIFGDFMIKVQPLTHAPWSAVSKHPFRGKKMRFIENLNSPSSKTNPFIISEIGDDEELEYVPENIFIFADKQSVPCIQHFLIQKCTHWWSETQSCIYFRPKEPHASAYHLDLATNRIKEDLTDRFLIDNSSPSFRQMMKIFRRFEEEEFVEVYLKPNSEGEPCRLDIQLRRMRLHFKVENHFSTLRVSSLEYPGMVLAEVQKCGTLVGLRSGLMLTHSEEGSANNVLLIPHGEVELPDAEGKVRIATSKLRNPLYFAYEVDSTLLQLKCGQTKSACAYLAYLHALTSHPLPDPFTQHTGTERATQLLQSGHCWSCEPYDQETAKTLSLIAMLSPVRKYNSKKKLMTTATWKLANSLSCSDCFHMIVDKLISDSKRLSVLFQREEDFKLESAGERFLCEKSYWRYFQCTTEQAHIMPNVLKIRKPIMGVNTKFDCSFADQSMQTLLNIVSLVNSWETSTYSARDLHLSLVSGRECLQGHLDPFPVEATVAEWQALEFWNSWLRLYIVARQVKARGLIEEWKMILASYAFMGMREDHLILLHTIAVYPEKFILDPPACQCYKDPAMTSFYRGVIRSTIESNTKNDYDSFLEEQMRPGLKIDRRRDVQIDGLTDMLWQTPWPYSSCSSIVYGYKADHSYLNLAAIIQSVDVHLKRWFDNYQLKQFVVQVENTVLKIRQTLPDFEFYATSICQKLTINEPSDDCKETKKPIEFNICGVMPKADFSVASESAKVVFQKGFVASTQMTNSFLQDVSQNSEVNKPAASNNYLNILSDPNVTNGPCKIWEHLVASLWVNSSHSESTLKHFLLKPGATTEAEELLRQLSKHSAEQQKQYWNQAESMLLSDPLVKLLVNAGIYQRITPLTLLPLIAHKEENLSDFQSYLRNVLGAFGVAETCKRHASRCLKYLKSDSHFELQRELANAPHQNWSPADRPEWLLFEIEMDLLIRPIQKRVAECMEHPKDGGNAVLQLNMGEGKTAVITPLLALALTNQKQLCRVTVLKSLFNTNRQALQLNLGGLLLNRRIYSLPCRRDFPMSNTLAEAILDIYKECMDQGGVNVTTPEYRLSLQLKTYEQCQAGQDWVAAKLLQIQDWLKHNARDILDESDEILHVKYQLIYALGVQMPPVGGGQRWAVLQRLLKHVPVAIKILAAEDAGRGCVEIFEDDSGCGAFPPCRLLKPEVYKRFCGLLVDEILSGTEFPNLQAEDEKLLRKFLTEEVIEQDVIERVFKFLFSESSISFVDKALILRGLMACGVLFTTLNKRWRVNYGVNPNLHSLLAVPFRAKDVAAERTEFGHVDVALVLTHLSYYYSGLNEGQVSECLFHVMQGLNPEMEYGGWIDTMTKKDPSIVSLRGINLENALQRNDKLFPALRKNKAVVDYWLANIMLPLKVKQFPEKITSTAWDLASDQAEKPTTGFSGTNDTQILLPLTIAQNDLPELKQTNFQVFQTLLLEENNNYESLPSRVMSGDILERLVKSAIPLLLDVGALMLDMDNKKVARTWLNLSEKGKSAAIYFNSDNRLMVIDRSSLPPVPFEISPFRCRLDQCVIYLDDVHTRGTDLKLPAGIRGCVTLGKGVTKDKLVQGCMRLRKLGQGHTVCFWASNEVNDEILALTGRDTNVGSAEVLRWALNNSRNTMREGFPYWVAAACNYLSKTAAQARYDASTKSDCDRKLLAEQVTVKEVTELKEMYGRAWSKQFYPAVAAQQLQKYCPDGACNDQALLDIRDRVIGYCHKFVPDLEKNAHLLDEEQERELEQEQEEERELERPAAFEPCTPKLNEAMVKFLKSERKALCHQAYPAWAMALPEGLKFTSLASINETSAWGNGLLVTKDFVNTVKTNYPQDSYLRTVNWIVSFKASGSWFWLLMSPFEVDQLIPMFRSGEVHTGLHMYAAKLSSVQTTLLELHRLVLPVSGTTPLTSLPRFNYCNASLSIFAGCTFFQSATELQSYCDITGYVPKPRSPEEERALLEGTVDNTGFLLPFGRERLRPNCHFLRNPERLIVGIITCRYNFLSPLCHVARLVHECRKPDFEE